MKRIRLILLILVSILAAYTVFGFFILPPIARSLISKNLGHSLKREVRVEEIKANPYKLTIDINKLSIKEKEIDETFFSLDGLHINLSGMSLLKWGLVVEELVIKGPRFRVERRKDGTFNFSDLAGRDGEKDEKTKQGKPLNFSIANIQISDGSVAFLERQKDLVFKLERMALSLPLISNFPHHSKVHVTPLFSASIDGAAMGLKGQSLPFDDTKKTLINIDIEALDLTRYIPYLPLETAFSVERALLDIKASIGYEAKPDLGHGLTAKGEISLRELKVLDANGTEILTLPGISVTMEESDLTEGRIHLKGILLKSPSIKVVREKDGGINLARLLSPKDKERKGPSEEASKKDSPGRPIQLAIDSIRIEGGEAFFEDWAVKGGFDARISELAFSLSDYSNRSGSKSPIEISFNTDKGARFSSKGEICLDPFSLQGRIDLGPVRPSDYEPYFGELLLFEVASGVVRLESEYKLERIGKDMDVVLSGMGLEIRDIALRRKGEKDAFFESPLMGIEGGLLGLSSRRIGAEAFFIKGGRLALKRDEKGLLNLSRLFAEAGAQRKEPASRDEGWNFIVKRALIEGYRLDFEDLSTPSSVRIPLREIRLEADDLTNEKGAKGKLDLLLTLEEKGTASVRGGFSINPLSAELRVDLAGVQVRAFQGYWLPYLNLLASKGTVRLTSTIGLRSGEGSDMIWNVKADTTLSDFSFLEKGKAQEILKWRSLDIKKLAFSSHPTSISSESISLLKPFFRISVEKDGRLNLKNIQVRSESEGKKGREAKSSAKISLGRFSLKDGRILFRDESISPTYSATLGEISLNLKGLTTDGFKAADIVCTGNLDGYAPLKVTGKLNPISEDIFADLKIALKGIPLSPMTPYSGRYIGYAIEKGNLSLDLSYLIEKKTLEAANKVILDQFTLGRAIESPQATSMPVELAIALLKDRNGLIELDLPVTGRLDDPQFSIGGIIFKMILNMLEKAITSPFALLGAVFGGGEDLSHFDFTPGSSLIDKDRAKAIDKLIEALAERPALRLEILGFVDEIKDTEALRRNKFLNRIKAMKIENMAKKGMPLPPLDELTIDEKEKAAYVEKVFKETRPKDSKDKQPGNISPEQMERDVLNGIAVGPDDLRLLALERTNAVRNYIMESGKVGAERIFVVQPASLSPEKKEGLVDSRVDFKLK
jgi:uncharacterized protein involved in outer membrane biogenesis